MASAVVLALLAVAAWWICTSPLRLLIAVVLAVHESAPQMPPAVLAVVLALFLLALAAAIVWRSLKPCGWRLLVTTKPLIASGHIRA
jgi:hypothetical protein